MTTVSPSHTSRQLHLIHNHICPKPLFTKFNRLSILVANSHNLILFRICSIFQPMEQALPSPSDGWHACSRRCQLALDLTARGTGFTALSGRLQRGWWFCFIVCFKAVAFVEKLFQCICDFSLSFSWQKGDRPDNNLRWAMQHPDKKTSQKKRQRCKETNWPSRVGSETENLRIQSINGAKHVS